LLVFKNKILPQAGVIVSVFVGETVKRL